METAKTFTAKQKIVRHRSKTEIGTGHPLLYALCSAIYSVIALGGLFLGFFFRNAPLGRIIAGGEPIFHGSLFGVVVEIVRGSISMPALAHGFSGVLPVILYFLIIVLVCVIALSMVFTILAFLRPKQAKQLGAANGCCVFLIYAALFLAALLCRAFTIEALDPSMFDFPTLVAASASLLFLVVIATARKGLQGIMNGLLLLWACAGALAFAMPRSPILLLLKSALVRHPDAAQIACLVLGALFLCNLLLSSLRINAGRWRSFDCVRFALQLIAALGLFVTMLSTGSSLSGFFQEPFSATVLFLSPFSGLFVSAFAIAHEKAGKNRLRRQ